MTDIEPEYTPGTATTPAYDDAEVDRPLTYGKPRQRPAEARQTRNLGWFSVGLGLAQLTMPGLMTNLIGAGNKARRRRVMQAVGAREVLAGLGLLSGPRPTGWLWARVAGDVIDLALLASVLGARKTSTSRLISALGAVAGVTAIDVLASRRLARHPEVDVNESDVSAAITINRPVEEVYGFWRDLGNLPLFMEHLESVTTIDNLRSRWKAHGPGGSFEWDAEIVADQPNQQIEWRSLAGSDVMNTGVVRFTRAPGGRGTEVHVQMQYDPPAGALGAGIAKLLFRDPQHQIGNDLRRFKQLLELGEVVHSDASIEPGRHPAQPVAEDDDEEGDEGRLS